MEYFIQKFVNPSYNLTLVARSVYYLKSTRSSVLFSIL